MGHASQIALGIAKNLPDKKVICLDGDGSLLMHMGSMAECATMKNLIHIVLNNGFTIIVGGQYKMQNISLIKIAEGFKYENVYRVKNQKKIRDLITKLLILEISSFIEVLCKPGYRKNLGRPKKVLKKIKKNL